MLEAIAVDKLLTIFKVPELRRKILFTALLLAIYRIGFYEIGRAHV